MALVPGEPISLSNEAVRFKYERSTTEFRSGQSLLVARTDKPQGNQLRFGKGLAGWMLFVGMSIIFFMLMHNHHPNAQPTVVKSSAPAWPGHVGWAGFYISILAIILTFVGGAARRRTKSPASMAIDDQGIHEISPGRHTLLRWERYESFAENNTMLVIRESPSFGLVIPKRLFSQPGELEHVRATLTKHLTMRVPSLAKGFEVKPV